MPAAAPLPAAAASAAAAEALSARVRALNEGWPCMHVLTTALLEGWAPPRAPKEKAG